jgi:hypothetical protein
VPVVLAEVQETLLELDFLILLMGQRQHMLLVALAELQEMLGQQEALILVMVELVVVEFQMDQILEALAAQVSSSSPTLHKNYNSHCSLSDSINIQNHSFIILPKYMAHFAK